MPPTHDEVLDYLYRLADTVCKEIDDFQPDLLVVLYHSAQIPLAAVTALWAETHTQPLPPVVRTNLGREKFAEYLHSSSLLEDYDYLPDYSWAVMDGHFLCWLADQQTLLTAVKSQIEEFVGLDVIPQRILVLDDFIHEGGTRLLSLGILHHLYPGVECRLLAGIKDTLKGHFHQIWLEWFHPGLLDKIKSDWKPVPDRWELRKPDSTLDWLIVGTTDVEWMSPDWVPITAEHERLSHLLPFLPAEEWLRLPVWMYAEIAKQIRRRVPTGVPEFAKPFTLHRRWLTPDLRIMGLAWQHRSFQICDVVERLCLPEDAAKEALDKLVASGYLMRCQQRDRVWYELPAGPGILLYGPMRIDPGNEITQYAEAISPEALTPFSVEFAHVGEYYGGAPILAVMTDGSGAPVPSTLLRMDPILDLDEVFLDFLIYPRYVLKRDEEKGLTYVEVASEKKGVIGIESLARFHDRERVLFLAPVPNLAFVMDQEMSDAEKGHRLAALAVESLTDLTYPSGTDGISYLIDAIDQGVETPLTAAYRDAVLVLDDSAPDLVTTRERLAARRGLGHLPVWPRAENRFA